ncbi:MAG: radical SAM protein [Candidatus Nezhaarchaeales archaeon]
MVRGAQRKYYRVARGGRWYGGIATADCVGCQLKCVFCWSNVPRDDPANVGRFYTPEQVFRALDAVASRRGYRQLRVSGNEPTLGREHLLSLLELVEESGRYLFILETNGILIGHDPSYAKELSKFSRVHVRVSLKGAGPEEFSRLTGAVPDGFWLQLRALEALVDHGVPCHPAVMLSFSSRESVEELRSRLRSISPELSEELEEEYVFLYPHVAERLRRAGLKPRVAYSPSEIPEDLI